MATFRNTLFPCTFCEPCLAFHRSTPTYPRALPPHVELLLLYTGTNDVSFWDSTYSCLFSEALAKSRRVPEGPPTLAAVTLLSGIYHLLSVPLLGIQLIGFCYSVGCLHIILLWSVVFELEPLRDCRAARDGTEEVRLTS